MCFVFLSSYRNSSGSLGEREMLWEHEPQASVPRRFRVLPNFHECFYLTNRFHVAVHLSRWLCTHKSCFILPKSGQSGAFPILTNTKKAIWRHLCSIQNESIPLVAVRWQRIVIGLGKSRHCQTWLECRFSWNENVQRRQELNIEIYNS